MITATKLEILFLIKKKKKTKIHPRQVKPLVKQYRVPTFRP